MVYLYPGYTAHTQTYLINENFNNESTVFSLLPSGDTLAWKFSKHGGVLATSCLVSDWVTNSSGSHADDYFASKSLSLVAWNTYQISLKCRVQTSGKRKAVVAWNTSASREGSTVIQVSGDDYNGNEARSSPICNREVVS